MIVIISKGMRPGDRLFCHKQNYLKQDWGEPGRSNIRKNGPAVVFENLIKELEQTPDIVWDLCIPESPPAGKIDIMWVVNDVIDLAWAVQVKSFLKVKELWAGPNLVVMPEESGGILTHPFVDKVIVPCQWVGDLYSQTPGLGDKIVIWPVGVDLEFWQPSGKDSHDTFLIYNKFNDRLAGKIAGWFEKQAISHQIITYGQYQIGEYKAQLEQAKGLIWLSRTESQGMALLEALAMDVPVLCLENVYWKHYSPNLKKFFTYSSASSAPYFSEQCGIFFKNFKEFSCQVFTEFNKMLLYFQPRNYLVENNLVVGKSLIKILH
jgi:glycosyltransferase involved in cell wall biosynthesis